MASVVGTPTTNFGDGSSGAGTVPTVGGGILSGDYIVMVFACCEAEDNTTTTPSGMDGEWLPELQVGQTPPSIPGVQVFYELCSGGESGTRTANLSFTSGWMIIMFVLRGVDTSTPLDVSNQTVQSTSIGVPNPPSITPTNDDCLILAVGIMDDTDTATLGSVPTNYTDLGFINNTTANPTGGNLMAAYRILSGGGGSPENPSAWTLATGGDDEWAAASIALRPGVTVSYEQEGHQFRQDNGSESGASDIGAQDSDISSGKLVNRRLRVLTDVTGDAPSEGTTLEFRLVGDPASEWEPVA